MHICSSFYSHPRRINSADTILNFLPTRLHQRLNSSRTLSDINSTVSFSVSGTSPLMIAGLLPIIFKRREMIRIVSEAESFYRILSFY
jgi:hypothetical protein